MAWRVRFAALCLWGRLAWTFRRPFVEDQHLDWWRIVRRSQKQPLRLPKTVLWKFNLCKMRNATHICRVFGCQLEWTLNQNWINWVDDSTHIFYVELHRCWFGSTLEILHQSFWDIVDVGNCTSESWSNEKRRKLTSDGFPLLTGHQERICSQEGVKLKSIKSRQHSRKASSCTHFRVGGEVIFVESVEFRHENVFDELQVADENCRLADFVESNITRSWKIPKKFWKSRNFDSLNVQPTHS